MADEEPHDNLFESENLTLEVARKLIAALQQQNQDLEELVEKLQGKNPTPRLDESYSLSAEEKRKQRQQRDADKKKKKAKRKQKKNARMKNG